MVRRYKKRLHINKLFALHKLSYPRTKVFLFVILFSSHLPLLVSYAGDHLVTATSNAAPSGKPTNIPNNSVTMDAECRERLFKTEVAWLKKKKAEHVRENRIQHLRNTEWLYKKAVRLYRYNKLTRAQETFRQIEYLTTNYKSTRDFLRIIDKRLSQESKRDEKPSSELSLH